MLIMGRERMYRVETRLSRRDDRMIISFRHKQISVSRSPDPPSEHVAMEANPCPCLVSIPNRPRSLKHAGIQRAEGGWVVYSVAHICDRELYSLGDYLPPDGVVFYKSRVDPLANTSIKPTLYRTVISSEARDKMRINQLTKLVYRAAGIIGDPGIGEIDHDR